MISREVSKKIKKDFFKGKVIVLVGARQVGKTTLVRSIIRKYLKVLELNADNPTDRAKLEGVDFDQLKVIAGASNIIYIDEAQKVKGIGNTLKLLADNFGKQKQIIVTGSSTINLLKETQEPLTGRKFVYSLYGLSVREIFPDLNKLTLDKHLSNLLVYGSYPEVYLESGLDKKRILMEITESYLYQDILELGKVRNPATLSKLLIAIALQLGSEVSLNELSNLTGLDLKTVERYIDLLEKSYVIFRLPPYSNNRRKTLSKLNKVYFYDLGIRNALINNFNELEIRNDVGALWENFLIVERMKLRAYKLANIPQYFWKTYDGAEVDLVEQQGGKLFGYEFKWKKHKTSPKSWLEYPNAEHQLVNRDNYLDFITKL